MKFITAFKEWLMVKSSGQPGPYYEISGKRENMITLNTNGKRVLTSEDVKDVIHKQIKPNFDLSAKNIIIFPHTVENVSMIFIDNIFDLVPKQIRKNYKFYDFFYIDASEKVTNKILDSVLVGWRL